MSCQGEPVEMSDMRTEEQKQAMSMIFGLLAGGMPYGATPRQQPMSAPPDQAQMQGMNIMTNLGHIMSGGQQPYTPYTYGSYPVGMQPPIPMPGAYTGPGGGGGGGGGGTGGGGGGHAGDWKPWDQDNLDPFGRPRPGPKPR